MANINRVERLQIMLDDAELKAIDDWRFARRMPSRASAIRELLRLGLAAEGTIISPVGVKSKEYGVVEGASKLGSRKQSRSSTTTK